MISPGCITDSEFKSVMRRFAACVNVITSVDNGVMNGMTATAVCSVTVDPPSVLIIVNRLNRSYPLISRSNAFAVNVLSSQQENVANLFASKKPEPFADVDHWLGKTGCPILSDADAYLECRVVKRMEFGTHTIFIGQIIACDTHIKSPLLYHNGCFCGLEKRELEHA